MVPFDERDWAAAWGLDRASRPEETETGGQTRRERRRPPLGAAVIAGAVLAGMVTTGAMAARGDALREGVRNGTTQSETEIIGQFNASTGAKGGYVTRQSNTQTGARAGGGAIYGCRGATGGTAGGSAPCLRASNLADGLAFEFASKTGPAGLFSVGDNPAATSTQAPFATNATGLVENLNADKVDGLDAAQLKGQTGPPGPPGSDAVAGVGLSSLGDAFLTASTTFVEVPGVSQTVTVPAGQQRRLLADFTAESACYGAGGYCPLRILVDGNELTPAVGNDFAFDSSDGNTEGPGSWESHSVQRYSGNLGAGDHTVTVEVRTTAAALNLRIDDAVLSTTLAAAG